METQQALDGFAALAHPTRLAVFRLLVRQGPLGMTAGSIAATVGVAPSTLSPHLAQLERSGLARASRVDRRIFYAVNVDGMRQLLLYLTEDCCQGHPELCRDLRPAGPEPQLTAEE